MSMKVFATDRCTVGKHIQLVVLEKEYNELPVFLDLTLKRNKATTTILIKRKGH